MSPKITKEYLEKVKKEALFIKDKQLAIHVEITKAHAAMLVAVEQARAAMDFYQKMILDTDLSDSDVDLVVSLYRFHSEYKKDFESISALTEKIEDAALRHRIAVTKASRWKSELDKKSVEENSIRDLLASLPAKAALIPVPARNIRDDDDDKSN
jgi:LmbE family N-acetylglucosaminyl deacetylase